MLEIKRQMCSELEEKKRKKQESKQNLVESSSCFGKKMTCSLSIKWVGFFFILKTATRWKTYCESGSRRPQLLSRSAAALRRTLPNTSSSCGPLTPLQSLEDFLRRKVIFFMSPCLPSSRPGRAAAGQARAGWAGR